MRRCGRPSEWTAAGFTQKLPPLRARRPAARGLRLCVRRSSNAGPQRRAAPRRCGEVPSTRNVPTGRSPGKPRKPIKPAQWWFPSEIEPHAQRRGDAWANCSRVSGNTESPRRLRPRSPPPRSHLGLPLHEPRRQVDDSLHALHPFPPPAHHLVERVVPEVDRPLRHPCAGRQRRGRARSRGVKSQRSAVLPLPRVATGVLAAPLAPPTARASAPPCSLRPRLSAARRPARPAACRRRRDPR